MAVSKYDPDILPVVTAWARQGLTQLEIANKLGISEKTFYVWKKKHRALQLALKDGVEEADNRVEDTLYRKAMNGDTTAMIFWLKNRKPNNWRDKWELTATGELNIRIGFEDDDGDS